MGFFVLMLRSLIWASKQALGVGGVTCPKELSGEEEEEGWEGEKEEEGGGGGGEGEEGTGRGGEGGGGGGEEGGDGGGGGGGGGGGRSWMERWSGAGDWQSLPRQYIHMVLNTMHSIAVFHYYTPGRGKIVPRNVI